MKAALRSSLVASVDIMVVIFPTLCESLARPLNRSDLRKIAPITCEAFLSIRGYRDIVEKHTPVRTESPVVIVTGKSVLKLENTKHTLTIYAQSM